MTQTVPTSSWAPALNRQSIEGYARRLGPNVVRFDKALDDGTQRGAIEADKTSCDQMEVSGTPTLILNTKRALDPTNYEALVAPIDSELAAPQN